MLVQYLGSHCSHGHFGSSQSKRILDHQVEHQILGIRSVFDFDMSRFIVALLLRVTLQCVEAVVSSPALIPPVVPPALSDPPCEFNAEETVDVPVVDQNGGLLNYKICSPAEVADIAGQVQDSPDAYDFEAGVRASLGGQRDRSQGSCSSREGDAVRASCRRARCDARSCHASGLPLFISRTQTRRSAL